MEITIDIMSRKATGVKNGVLLHFKFNTLACNTAVAMTTFDVLL